MFLTRITSLRNGSDNDNDNADYSIKITSSYRNDSDNDNDNDDYSGITIDNMSCIFKVCAFCSIRNTFEMVPVFGLL